MLAESSLQKEFPLRAKPNALNGWNCLTIGTGRSYSMSWARRKPVPWSRLSASNPRRRDVRNFPGGRPRNRRGSRAGRVHRCLYPAHHQFLVVHICSCTTPKRFRPYRARLAGWLRRIHPYGGCAVEPAFELLHLVGSHSPGQGNSRSESPPVAASCHSHSVGKRMVDPIRLLSHLQNATASNQETVSRGELASFQ